MAATLKIKPDFKPLAKFMKDETVNELLAQGHKATGRLASTASGFVSTAFGGDFEVNVELLEYYIFLEKGIKGTRIPFGGKKRGTGGARSQYIFALKTWVKQKRIATSDKQALGIAFAIAHTQRKEGNPTSKSYLYSSNGRRKRFQEIAIRRKETMIISFAEKEMKIATENAFYHRIAKLIA